ncbi:MAG: peptidase C39 family protein [Dermatophilaceae bacterium]
MRHVTLTTWESGFEWVPLAPVSYADPHAPDHVATTFQARSWESPVVASSFPGRELVPSWNARTPTAAWLLIEARVDSDLGWTPWFTVARWAEHDLRSPGVAGRASTGVAQQAPASATADPAPEVSGVVTRTTLPGQDFEAGRVVTDTYRSAPHHPFSNWQLRVTALTTKDQPTDDDWPKVSLVAGMVSAFDGSDDEPPHSPSSRTSRELAVPPLSQRLHADTYPDWDSGGQTWCSPTSTTMLLSYWGLEPSAAESAWVGHDTDPAVVHAVRHVFDPAYGGAGNWAFNTAYAATRGLRAYVTRLRDLTEAEQFIAAGIPLAVSVSFEADELDGAGYGTAGHLLTVIGFTEGGDVISNDPSSHEIPDNTEVRAVYHRDQFERAWLRGSQGLTYVMHPPHVALPTPPDERNWA